jgi:hypothetical protein
MAKNDFDGGFSDVHKEYYGGESTYHKSTSGWGYISNDKTLLKAFGVDALEAWTQNSPGHPQGIWLFGLHDKKWYLITNYYMCQFPGLCGACMLSNLAPSLTFEFTDKRHDALIKAIVNVGYITGYTRLITSETKATSFGATETEAYERCGFKVIEEFTNKRTSHKIQILSKEL